MKCPKCGNDFTPVKKNNYETRYCSRSCANTRTPTLDTRKKQSESLSRISRELTVEQKNSRAEKLSISAEKTNRFKLVNVPFNDLGMGLKRRKIFEEQNGRCLHCGNDENWQGKKLTLELDHINGIRTDDSRQNLRLLCPNCHSVTETFCAQKNLPVTDYQIIEAALTANNICQIGKAVGYTSGNAYRRIKRVLAKANLVNIDGKFIYMPV